MKKRILVIAPHSDDAELGVGGYLHREIQKGARADIAVLASGSVSGTKRHANVTTFTRKDEGKLGGEVLGVTGYEFLEAAPDSAFNTVPRGQLVKAIEQVVFSRKVHELFIPLPSFHQDHVVAHDACVSALRPHLGRELPDFIYAYEYPGQAWGPTPPAAGKVYAPLSPANLTAKLAALAAHKSQWASDTRSLYGVRGVTAMAELRGAEIGAEAAELFYLYRSVTR